MLIRRRFFFRGVVQGVGFRPYIYRLAVRCNLSGFVRNRPDGVIAEVEGSTADVEAFSRAVVGEMPPMADIAAIDSENVPVSGEKGFRIAVSDDQGQPEVYIAPDTAVCGECVAELFDPADRRYRYPFINCTNCGPRLTIISDIPYDRPKTSMACFTMCRRCRQEYENPADRRFHAEPNACPDCGPQLSLLDDRGRLMSDAEPTAHSIALLEEGAVIAVKGLGGYHLVADAANDAAVRRLRMRKLREEKPLAIMVRDAEAASFLVDINDQERELLNSPERPIVLLDKKSGAGALSDAVAPQMTTLGIMLPYTPLQHLLLAHPFKALVMTSANRTDEPICIGNREAVARLQGIADYFLAHDRDILVRCDDSIALVAGGAASVLRRSRGFAPKPLLLKRSYEPVLALGPQIKSTLCLLKGDTAFLSPHVGDLETPEARDFFHETMSVLARIAECRPRTIACDLHPGYYSSHVARQMMHEGDFSVVPVQHHHAHIVSCMVENGITGDVIGLAMDGTGYGTDGHIWGGEFFIADEVAFRRAGHLRPFPLPGAEAAIREPWRTALGLLREAYGSEWPDMAKKLRLLPDGASTATMEKIMSRGVNVPVTTSMGRVFDGVAAVLGLRSRVSFEGQAAMELEATACAGALDRLPFEIFRGQCLVLDLMPTLRALIAAMLGGVSPGELSFAFHEALSDGFASMAEDIRRRSGYNRAVLSGGCFQNRILLKKTTAKLEAAGFAVFRHKEVPTNDGGISLGQAVCAAHVMERKSSLS